MARFRCALGFHDFAWPPHRSPWPRLWEDYYIECARGCGARKVRHCFPDWHFEDKHPEPEAEDGA